MQINIKRLRENAKLPTQGTAGAAGWDLYASLEGEQGAVRIFPHSNTMIGTGVAAAIPRGYVGLIFARSGLSSKESLRPANCVGVIDSDYRGELKVALHNDSTIDRFIAQNERIAQLVIVPFASLELNEVDELDETDRGSGGFGSTGK